VFVSLLLASLLLAPRAGGHTLPISFLYVVPDADYLHLELMLNPFELSFFSVLDTIKDGRLDQAELQAQQELLTRRILNCLELRVNGDSVVAEIAGITPEADGHHLTLRAQFHIDARKTALQIESSLSTITSGSHLTQVTYLCSGHRQLAQLVAQSAKVTFAPLEQTDALPAPLPPSKRGGLPRMALLLLAIPGLALLAAFGWRSRKLPQTTQAPAR
jgi:hypothetical protein